MKYLLLILLIGCTTSKKVIPTPILHTIILDGTNSKIINGDGKGYIQSFQWKQIQGSIFPIENPSLVKTQTNVASGTYAWELTGIDNLGNTGKDTFRITVN